MLNVRLMPFRHFLGKGSMSMLQILRLSLISMIINSVAFQAEASDDCLTELIMKRTNDRLADIKSDPLGYLSSIDKIIAYRRREEAICLDIAKCMASYKEKIGDEKIIANLFNSCLEE